MAEKTNNNKAITKDYLAEQFFLYHDKYINKGIEAGKQANLIVDTTHITWDNPKLGLKIDNDKDAQENDYISLKNLDGTLTWKTPIIDQSEIDNDNENLVTGKAIFNFEGSRNIKTVGTISEGSWDVGDIQIDDNSLKISDFTIKQEETGKLSILSEEHSGLIIDSLSLKEKLTVENIETSNLDTSNLEADDAAIGDCKVYNLKIGISEPISTITEDEVVYIKFDNNIFVAGDIKVKDIDFTEPSFSIKTGTTNYLTFEEKKISLYEDITANKNITALGTTQTNNLIIKENSFTLGKEELTIATDAEINSFFEDWQS
jgi:hypothetical protein